MLDGMRGGWVVVLGAVVLGAAAGCGDSADPEPRVVFVRVMPSDMWLHLEAEEQFAAEATWSDGTTGDVTERCVWDSSDDSVATVDVTGIVVGHGDGEAEITCTFEGVVGTATVVLEVDYFELVIVESPDAPICVGDTAELTARAVLGDGTDADVTDTAVWTSSDEGTATVDEGVVTGVGMGTVTITATFSGLESNPATVIVTSCDGLEHIQITPASATIGVGATQPFTAIGVRRDGTSDDVTADVGWESSDPDVATIDLDGVATGVAGGTAAITASLDGITSNDAELTVIDDRVVEVVVAPPSATLHAGSTETAAFTATAIYPDATTEDVTELAVWTSSDETVATVSNVPGSCGVVTPDVSNRGTARIKAAWSGLSSDEAVVEVVPSETILSVAVEPAAHSMGCGMSVAMTATATYSDGMTFDVTGIATWSSSDEAVATVTGGVVTAPFAAAGTATITAMVAGSVGTADVFVTCDILVSISVLPAGPTNLCAGRTQAYRAIGTFTDGRTADLTGDSRLSWSSSIESVATISNAAGSEGVATAVGIGSTSISARFVDGMMDVTSGPAFLSSLSCIPSRIDVAPPSASVGVGSTVGLRATVVYSFGGTDDVTDGCTWSSSDGSIATVTTGGFSGRGVVTGVAPGGPVTVTAGCFGFLNGSSAVTVVP